MSNENEQVDVDSEPGAAQQEKSDHDKVRTFKVQIDKAFFDVREPTPTGRHLLTLAGKVPAEQFAIYLRIKGSQPQRIGLDDKVDLREPGVERFVTLPLDQTEG